MDYSKLAPGLASMVDEFQETGIAASDIEPGFAPLSASSSGGTPSIRMFVRCDSNARFDHLNGVRVHQDSGVVRTAEVPLDQVGSLSDEASVVRLAPSTILRPLLDVALPHVSVPSFRSSSGTTGNNVVVGIIDSGIDVSHPAFQGRIHSIWDQTIPGNGWGTTNYGAVLSGPTLTVSQDQNGHGTHVAGIAAGDDATFLGVAPSATLVVIKTDFSDTGIADGVRYVFQVADDLGGLPAVANLSLGGHGDPHDGTDDLSVAIDGETGPGRLVIAAAGNEGSDDIHAAFDAPGNSTLDVPFRVDPNSAGQSPLWVVLNGWYSGSRNLEVAIQTSSGDDTGFQAVITPGNPTQNYTFLTARIRITTPVAAVNPNGDHQFRVEIRPGLFGSEVQGGTWRLRVRNVESSPTSVNVWSIVSPDRRDARFLGAANSSSMKIGSPGSASSVVTVAAFTTRNQWTDASGAGRGVGLTLNDIADFSSPGPLRNGDRKPDVTAPGAMIVSCLSGQSVPPSSNIVATGFRVNAGTSMACPLISGLTALLLERDPTLDPNGLKDLLRQNSTVPGQPTGTYDPTWGFGLIDSAGL
jgi:subtilisin family serine protease